MGKGLHTPVATLRRDLNSEYVALSRIMRDNFVQDRQQMIELAMQIKSLKRMFVLSSSGFFLIFITLLLSK